MLFRWSLLLLLLCTAAAAQSSSKVSFQEPLPVKWFVGPTKNDVRDMQVRALVVEGEVEYFTTGEPHTISEDAFVIRQAYRIEDAEAEDEGVVPEWLWQRGTWLLVERASADVTELKLPDFDPFHSVAAWNGDMVAYCGLSDDAENLYGVVAQVGERKPLHRVPLGRAANSGEPDAECDTPEWTAEGVIFRPAGEEETLVPMQLTKDERERKRLTLPEEFRK